MRPGAAFHWFVQRFKREHRGVRSFEQALHERGGMASAVDRGISSVEVSKIVGSVNRWQVLRSDFFYRTGKAMTQRFRRVGAAMLAGKALPALELYKLKAAPDNPDSEYYVIDGHHRVAMARRLGQDFLDAHVVEYQPRDAQLAHTLRHIPLFREVPATDLIALWRSLTEIRVPAGSIICRRGEPGDRFYIIQSGSVEVCLGIGPESVSLNRLGAGDCFGEMALLAGEARSADVVALEDARLWSLQRLDFERLVDQSAPMLRALNRSLVQRLALTTAIIESSRLARGGSGPGELSFGPYRIMAQIGAGGMSVVYSALREDDGVAVALKVLPASWGAAPDLRERLQREAALLQRIEHPGVIRLLDVGPVAERAGGGIYIAMEWIPDALDRVLYARYPHPLEPAEALRIGLRVAEALRSVHAAGLVHRDVKPSNILLRADGQPVLTDFGLAAALLDTMGVRRLTPPDTLVGTADYLAPEVIAGHAVDGRADLYALGVVMYEMLSGHVPFAGRDPIQTLRAHLEEPVPELPEAISPSVRALVARALMKDPDRRFASADEMCAAISSRE